MPGCCSVREALQQQPQGSGGGGGPADAVSPGTGGKCPPAQRQRRAAHLAAGGAQSSSSTAATRAPRLGRWAQGSSGIVSMARQPRGCSLPTSGGEAVCGAAPSEAPGRFTRLIGLLLQMQSRTAAMEAWTAHFCSGQHPAVHAAAAQPSQCIGANVGGH